jgi:pimeloyl-ACP methyl ester carboxylesterase
MLRKSLLVLAALVAAIALIAFAALRDDPARPATGERRTVRSGDAEIHYFVGGPRAGNPVALVPSFGRSASDFNELVHVLNEAGHRTIAMQPRGIDGSTLPSLQVSLHTYATDLEAVIGAEVGDGPVVAIGHAYGNRVARTLATDVPERVRALVLLAAGGADPPPPEATRAISQALFSLWPDGMRREAIRFAFFAEGNPVPEYWMRGWYPRAGLAQASALSRSPFEEWGAGGRAPIFVVQAAEDVVAAGAGERLKRRFPTRVRVETIPGAGHALLPEQPERVGRVVLAHLQSL